MVRQSVKGPYGLLISSGSNQQEDPAKDQSDIEVDIQPEQSKGTEIKCGQRQNKLEK